MKKISVPGPNGPLVMSVKEAERLLRRLTAALERGQQKFEKLQPPVVKDGFLSRKAVLDFFGQIYSDQELRNRASKLFANLVRAAVSQESSKELFNVIHQRCRQHVNTGDCSNSYYPNYHLYSHKELYLIEVASLKQYAPAFLTMERRNVGPGTSSDLNLLLKYL